MGSSIADTGDPIQGDHGEDAARGDAHAGGPLLKRQAVRLLGGPASCGTGRFIEMSGGRQG